MTVRKWAICGLVIMGLTALWVGEANISGIILLELLGF